MMTLNRLFYGLSLGLQGGTTVLGWKKFIVRCFFSIFIVKRKLPSGYWQIAVVWVWVGLSEIYILSLSQCNKNLLEVVRSLIGLMAFSWAWVNSCSISYWRIGGHKALLSSCLAFPSNKDPLTVLSNCVWMQSEVLNRQSPDRATPCWTSSLDENHKLHMSSLFVNLPRLDYSVTLIKNVLRLRLSSLRGTQVRGHIASDSKWIPGCYPRPWVRC